MRHCINQSQLINPPSVFPISTSFLFEKFPLPPAAIGRRDVCGFFWPFTIGGETFRSCFWKQYMYLLLFSRTSISTSSPGRFSCAPWGRGCLHLQPPPKPDHRSNTPKIFPRQSLMIENSRKRPPLIGDRDHFFSTSWGDAFIISVVFNLL